MASTSETWIIKKTIPNLAASEQQRVQIQEAAYRLWFSLLTQIEALFAWPLIRPIATRPYLDRLHQFAHRFNKPKLSRAATIIAQLAEIEAHEYEAL